MCNACSVPGDENRRWILRTYNPPMDGNWLQIIAVYTLPVVFAITVHEAAHGWMAQRLGDPTAHYLGRISLNPVRHIDPVGTLLVPGLTLVVGGAVGAFALFGWAKPVPVDPRYFRHPTRDMAWVAAAGPGVNLLMALSWALLGKLMLLLMSSTTPSPEGMLAPGSLLTPETMAQTVDPFVQFIAQMAKAGIVVNIALMVLNLLPLPPLDGSRVLSAFLPPSIGWRYAQLERYGLWILLILLFTGILGSVVRPVTAWLLQGIVKTFGLH